MSENRVLPVSKMAENLVGSEIIKLAGLVNEKIKKGEHVHNLTIGDFDPQIFPIPKKMEELIVEAYQDGETNYPPADGILSLREQVSLLLKNKLKLDYSPSQVLIAGGARPLIYATFQALVNPGDVVLFPIPSWNNNHYTHLSQAKMVAIETKSSNNFMPTSSELEPHIKTATLLALCSPLNPTGTVFSKKELGEICDLVVKENKRRETVGERPLYVMYDQIYWMLTFGGNTHHDPVSLNPEMKNYTVYIDGISKSLAATGVRLGWAFGPQRIMDKMKAILGHIGAWSGKAEQVGTANYFKESNDFDRFTGEIKERLGKRLMGFYEGLHSLKREGLRVDAIAPQGAIYLTVQVDYIGFTTRAGVRLNDAEALSNYLINNAGVAMVPFYAFGVGKNSNWFRLSVGTCKSEEIENVTKKLGEALKLLKA